MSGSHDTTAALANARLISVTMQSLLEVEGRRPPEDEHCKPLIAQFAQSLRGERRVMYSS